MQNLWNELETLLKEDARFLSEQGTLLKNKIIELALALSPDLLRLLLSNKSMCDHFFISVDKIKVFDKIKFQQFISNKSFLPDSYTAYKNKIGLTVDNEYIAYSKKVVLAWPYKDCILEGGQTKEDAKRNEIFWNETLAPDQIDRLLSPKVLTNFKKFDKKGNYKVTEITQNDNLIIKGNNLLALHTLKDVYAGKVKLIYIDPPYNTGNDSFKYNDNFNHSTWLAFMKNRLEIARYFLREDGAIFVQCDDNEQAYLKVLMDEIFGKNNFVSTIITRSTPNARDYGLIARMHEYIIFYAKNINQAKTNLLETEDKKFNFQDEKGKFNIHPLYNSNVNFNIENRKNLYYPFYLNSKVTDKNNFFELSMEKTKGSIEIFPPKSIKDHIQFVWRWGKEKSLKNINKEIVGHKIKEGKYRIVQKMRNFEQLARSLWIEKEVSNRRATEDLQKLFSKKVFSFPKSEFLIKKLIYITTNENDIILDFHLGSGTTATVAQKMKRRYIGIEQMDYINTVTVERLKKVIEGEQGGISQSINWQGGGSFIYCELAQANQTFLDKIQDAKNTKSLQVIWDEMQIKGFLSYQIDFKKINLQNKDFRSLNFDDQKRFLIETLDKNMLYIPLSEIDDKTYNFSKEDKKLNTQFHNETKIG